MKRRIVWLSLVVGGLGLCALLLRPMDWHITITRGTEPPVTTSLSMRPSTASAQTAAEGVESLRSQSKAFVHIAKEVLPSVVTITTERTVQVTGMPGGRGGLRFFGDDFFRFFETPDRVPQTGSGSGVIISPDGYILTNNHVVREADQIRVTLEDGRQFQAEMVGTDPKSDVAVIRIEADDLTAARLGNSDELEVGEWVLAIGNPFQLSSTVTAGIVSAVGRSNIGLADYEDFIQTDAAINPGNSGGALVNLNGEVVGINTAIATRNGANQGVGFAIPINMASRIKNSLIQDGKVVRGWLGVNIQNLNESTAEIFGLDRPRGALVSQVVPGSPAADAGVRPRDVIIQLDGRPVKDVEDLQLRVVDRSPGTKVDLTVLRDGRERAIEVKLGELEAEAGGASGAGDNTERWSSRDDGRTGGLGLSLEELSREARRELQLPQSVDGVLVTDVDPAKPAGRAGLQRGDVITKVGDREVLSIRAFRDAIQDQDRGRPVLFEVQRGESQIFLGVKLPE